MDPNSMRCFGKTWQNYGDGAVGRGQYAFCGYSGLDKILHSKIDQIIDWVFTSGQVDAFSVSPVKGNNSNEFSIPRNQPILWGNVHVNIQGGYDVTTGM